MLALSPLGKFNTSDSKASKGIKVVKFINSLVINVLAYVKYNTNKYVLNYFLSEKCVEKA